MQNCNKYFRRSHWPRMALVWPSYGPRMIKHVQECQQQPPGLPSAHDPPRLGLPSPYYNQHWIFCGIPAICIGDKPLATGIEELLLVICNLLGKSTHRVIIFVYPWILRLESPPLFFSLISYFCHALWFQFRLPGQRQALITGVRKYRLMFTMNRSVQTALNL